MLYDLKTGKICETNLEMGKAGVSVQFKKTDQTSDSLDELLYRFKRYIQTKSSARPYIDWYLNFEYHEHGDVIEYYYKNFKLLIGQENEFEFKFTIWDDNEETAKEIYAETKWCYKTNSEVEHETSVITLAKDFAKRKTIWNFYTLTDKCKKWKNCKKSALKVRFFLTQNVLCAILCTN